MEQVPESNLRLRLADWNGLKGVMQATPTRTGILLINLGTPDAPTPWSVAKYLAEFLMDPYVIDIPVWARAALVYGVILPRRPFSSARAYQQVWTKNGSPLLCHTLELAEKVQAALGNEYLVAPAMRYGSPSIPSAIEHLKAARVSSLRVLPLYPQYSLAATESSLACVKACLEGSHIPVNYLPPFYHRKEYLNAVASVSREALKDEPSFDHFLFSFHGIPERQIKRLPGCDRFCSFDESCCNTVQTENKSCYRAQCFETARQLSTRLEIPNAKFTISFQSRLGRTPWIRPYTDLLLPKFAEQGVRKLAVFCPSFVADCLETLEEIQIRGQKAFQDAGGEKLTLIPSLNAQDAWAEAVGDLVRS